MWFKLGDLLASVGVGALAAFLAASLMGPGWHPVAAMIAGMALGTAVQLLCFFLLLPLLGAFEVMVPSMLAGMLGAMGAGMGSAMQGLTPKAAPLLGAGVGLATWLWVEIEDRRFRGEVR